MFHFNISIHFSVLYNEIRFPSFPFNMLLTFIMSSILSQNLKKIKYKLKYTMKSFTEI